MTFIYIKTIKIDNIGYQIFNNRILSDIYDLYLLWNINN